MSRASQNQKHIYAILEGVDIVHIIQPCRLEKRSCHVVPRNVPPMSNLQLKPSEIYSDPRAHGFRGPTRSVRLYRATPSGGGAISTSEDGVRCAVTGKECLRVIRITDGSRAQSPGHKSSVGRGGHRIDASRNFWDGSGLKIDSASTDVAWGRGVFSSKILTSARNGELIMWDLNKSGTSKYERRSKDHIRSIHTMSVSHIVHHYCITGSADGDMRVWDLRDLTRSLMRVHHPTSVRSVVFSPSTWQPLHAVVGLDNGSIYRWDLKMGQRGLLDRLPVAHTASVTTLDWCNLSSGNPSQNAPSQSNEQLGNGLGWLVSGGLDRCVKVWDLTAPANGTRIPNKPTYTLHPSFQVRRVGWRPGFECELAVVSNVEYSTGSNSDVSQKSGAGTENRVDKKALEMSSIGGDAVEIWDVRREWVPKWSVTGSAAEGGVTDIAFGSSDLLWTHNSSGTFAQLDLRSCTKPLDAFTPVAVSWEVSGSLAFVAEREKIGQIPFDDIAPERRPVMERLRVKTKALGDSRFAPTSQNMGTLISDDAIQELVIFKQLAQGYVLEGYSSADICAKNAKVALQAGQTHIAQAWLLLGASLQDCLPSHPTTPPLLEMQTSPPLPHSMSAPAALPNTHNNLSGLQPVRKSSPPRGSPVEHRFTPRSVSASASRKMTPASSNSSSPRQVSSQLPPITPRRPSLFTGRDMIDPDPTRRVSISLYRRPSISTHSMHSISPGERLMGGSLRHVGEGALDDSDSSSSESGNDDDPARGSSDEETNSRPLVSPSLPPTKGIITPSPLSRVAGQQQWTEDEATRDNDDDDDEASPSPRSTDTESTRSNSPPRKPKSHSKASKRHSTRIKSRSRSSTVASLAAPPIRALAHRDSFGSIRTVTAGETSFRDQDGEAQNSLRDLRDRNDREISHTVSEFAPNSPIIDRSPRLKQPNPSNMTDRRIEMVCSDEKRFQDLTWEALREALEGFADEGDVQTCAMLAMTAPEELRFSKRRLTRFVDAYLDLLTRHRMHACAAYLRRNCRVQVITNMTLLETTIYTTCGKCKKPLIVPAGSQTKQNVIKGGFSYCKRCKTACTTCAICRLPVRGLLLQCSICSHGGHQACYRQYYAQHVMVDLPRSFSPPAASGSSRTSVDIVEEDATSASNALSSNSSGTPYSSGENSSNVGEYSARLVGHPCAAGCGHFCWATSNVEDA